MISFTLKCEDGHRFDSWFQSSDAFDKLQSAGMVNCAVCGSAQVEKAIMAPRVSDSKSRSEPDTPLTRSEHPAEQTLAELRRKIEENSEYVGMNFAREARDIHDGISPERAIYGEAKPEDAKKLIEDGVPVAPLPFVPARKTN
ncbi:DUF1178 family protein [Roseovarius faecimaris]|uniref:DUF1178 family protein n=1 Tax=Roseovarius faecimaris TaxID=2494550 RepID=A0A6I6INX6_9RHOB|nr:DUF1178 family protein [Roseovarius faecimaris]QGX97511.1 DUF1178 family protein [Roseovarius faecimaris]